MSNQRALLKYCLNPLHWPMLCLVGLILLLIQMPRSFYKLLTGIFVFFVRLLLRLRSRVIMTNLKLCFPALSEEARKCLLRSFISSTVSALFDTVYAYYNQFFNKIPVETQGIEVVHTAMNNHRPVILLTAHFNTTFLAGKFLHDSLNHKVANVFREQSHPLINYLYERKQLQYFMPIRKSNIRKMINALHDNYPVIYLFDLNDSQGKAFIPFFKVQAATKTSICKIARLSDAVVIPYACFKKSDGKYHLEFLKPLENFPSEDPSADLTRVSLLFEDLIKQYPEQYLWTHRRFKTRPEGENNIY